MLMSAGPPTTAGPVAAETGCWIVEYARVPVHSEPSFQGEVVAELSCGDVVLCERADAAAEAGGDWLRLQAGSQICHVELGGQQRRRARGRGDSGNDGDDGGGGSSSSCSSSNSPRSKVAAASTRYFAGVGYVPKQHCFVGTLLRYLGVPTTAEDVTALGPQELTKGEIEEVLASVHQEDMRLPPEVKVWSRVELEHFAATGQRPEWRNVADEQALVGAEMSSEQLEGALRDGR